MKDKASANITKAQSQQKEYFDRRHFVEVCCISAMFIVMTSYHFSNSKRELKCFWKNFSGREGNLQKGLKGHTSCIIAFAYHAAIGDNLRTLIFDQGRMRSHLLSCFERSELTPFPLATTTTDTIRRCALRHHVIILHCTCRMPESGKMI